MASGNNAFISSLLCLSLCLHSSLSAALFEYGEKVGDLKVPKGRDVAQQVEFPVDFLRMPFQTLYISTKGAILFDTPAEPQSRMIAPFFADIDNRKKGTIWYRSSPSEKDLARATQDIQRYFPSRQLESTDVDILVVTWENVSVQRNRGLSKGITFQAVVITDHHYTFVEYIYGDNVYPRARAIPVSPVIGFSTSNVEYFDYAIAEDTKAVFKKTKSSNVNEQGVWVFQVDGINPYDIVWGIPEGGNIQGDQNVLADSDTDLNINLGAVGDDCSRCSAQASCVDYSAGSCCVCNSNYMGDGKVCLVNETNRHYRANGALRGTLNGQQLSNINIHVFILASEGRTFTAISPTPLGLNYTLQLLLPVGETIGWLFALPKNKGMNGMMITGGNFQSTTVMAFSTGEELTITQTFTTSGESIRSDVAVDGTLPVLEAKQLTVAEHSEMYTRHQPGIIHSFERRRVSSPSSNFDFTVEQTIEYDDCRADEAEFDPLLNSMTLETSSINAFHEEVHPHVRYSMRTTIGPVQEIVADPCVGNRCDRFASCLPDADSYRCECFEGYTGNGFICEEEVYDPCLENTCDENAECTPLDFSYNCTCNKGYTGDGFLCKEEVVDPCASNRCSNNAVCIPDGSSYRCQCRPGFEGNGFACFEIVIDPCDGNECSLNADCYPDGESYICKCRSGYEGSGFVCSEIPRGPCDRNRCHAQALCIPEGRSYYCECGPGYEGDGIDCVEEAADPCRNNVCDANADCIPQGSSYACRCVPGYEGDGFACAEIPVDPCLGNRCDINADCYPQGSSYTCRCARGYEGNGFECEEVVEDPCLNNDCNQFARCVPDQDQLYDCLCLDGYEGDGYTCVAYPCNNNNCDINADCFGNADGRGYVCACREGYVGNGYSCEAADVDVCLGNECDVNGQCIPFGDSYDCQCREGFLGNGYFCIAEDPCFDNDCDVNAECDPVGDSYQCVCISGYQGDGFSCQVVDCSSCDANALCLREGAGFSCVCNSGFQGNGQICEDVDECREFSPCDPNAYCDNTFGNYICSCREGFIGDGVSCQVAVRPSGDGMLLYGQGMAVMEMPLVEGEKGTRVLHKKRQTIVGLAYDCVDELIYFTDVSKGSIGRVRPDGTEYKRLIKKGLRSPEGVAVDHLSRNLYWTDSGFDQIEVASLDGRSRRVLVKTDLVNPRAIVADPVAGYLYWSDWNREDPKIERSLMDGSEREVLVKEGLELPNGLTIDQISQKICWADAGSEKVECMNVNGDPLTRVTVFAQADYPFGLAAFDQNLYWTDWTSNSVFAVNKNGALSAEEMTLPPGGTGRLYGIISVQECSQGSNACAYDNGGCSSLCLPLPRGERVCACPTDSRGNEIPC